MNFLTPPPDIKLLVTKTPLKKKKNLTAILPPSPRPLDSLRKISPCPCAFANTKLWAYMTIIAANNLKKSKLLFSFCKT